MPAFVGSTPMACSSWIYSEVSSVLARLPKNVTDVYHDVLASEHWVMLSPLDAKSNTAACLQCHLTRRAGARSEQLTHLSYHLQRMTASQRPERKV